MVIASWDKPCDLKYWLGGCLLLTTCVVFRKPLRTFTHRYLCLWRPEPNAEEPARIRALYWSSHLVAYFVVFEAISAVETAAERGQCQSDTQQLCDWAKFLSPYGAIGFLFAWCVQRNAHVALLSLSGANARNHWPRPADPTVINRLQPVVVEAGMEQCSICLENYDDQPSAKVTPCCANNFHEECLKHWLSQHRTCPLCRADVEDVLDVLDGVV